MQRAAEVRADYNSCDRVTVYGTLRVGNSNHRLLDCAELLSTERIPGFALYGMGRGFPYAVRGVDDTIVGEVYRLESVEQLFDCDSLEGVPYHYQRHLCSTSLGPSWIYSIDAAERFDLERIVSGDWADARRWAGRW